VFAIREGIYHEKWWEIALVPIRAFFQGEDGNPKHFDGKLNAFLLLLPPFAFWRRREEQMKVKREQSVMLAFVVFFFVIAFFSVDFRVRYILPTLPLLVVLSVLGAERLHRLIRSMKEGGKKRFAVALFFLAVCSALLYNGKYLIDQFNQTEPIGYLAGKISRDEYLDRHRPENAALRYVNQRLPRDSKLMLIFLGGRGYYCDRSYVHGEEALCSLFINSEGVHEVKEKFKRMGITHLVIYEPLFAQWLKDNLGETARKTLKPFFFNYVKLLYSEKGFSVFALQNVFS
jgi:hypothetical protein